MQKIKYSLQEQKTWLILFLLALIMSFASEHFLTGDNIINVLTQAAIYGIMACGMTFAILSGDFDLSVGSTMALSGLVAIMLQQSIGQFSAIAVAIFVSILIGLINGILIARFKMSSFIVTIGMSQIIKGIALRISDGRPQASINEGFNSFFELTVLGIPVLIIIMVIFVAATAYILYYSNYGRNVYTIGGSREVAHNSGIRVERIRVSVFVICAACAGVAGILNAAKLNTAAATYGDNASLNVITGVVIGGTSLSGGIGGIGKSLSGILLFTTITNALDLMGVYTYYQTMVRGLLLIGIIVYGAYTHHNSSK